MKRIIVSTLLCLLICVNCYAFSDIYDSNVYDAVEKLSEFSIINGYEDGTFRPNNTITRAEFAKIIVAMANLYQKTNTGYTFKDVSGHWAKEYITIAQEKGIINGVSNDMFAPDDNVTYEQALKMIVCALGYGEDAETIGGYPNGYIEMANDIGIISRVDFVNDNYATRGDIALIVEDALMVPFYSIGNSNGKTERFNTNKTLYDIHSDLIEFNQIDNTDYDYDDNTEEAVG